MNIFLVDVRSKLIFWFTCKERKLLKCYSFSSRKKDSHCYSCITCSLPCQQRLHFHCVSYRATLICYARLMQDSHNALNRSRREKNPGFFNLFVHISGRIWMVVSGGYFLHDSSHSKNVASAFRVLAVILLAQKQWHTKVKY